MELNGLPIQPVTFEEQVTYHCTCCGNCCRHVKDAIMLDGYDLYQLARHFHKPLIEVTNRYATSMPLDETGYPIFLLNTVGSDDACVFLKNNRCTVQNAKPRTCRLYPFTAGPGETKEKLRFYLCLEKSHHFCGGTIQVGDWLRECFDDEDHRFLTAEYDYIPQIAPLVHLLTGERQRLALTQIVFFRYFNFNPNRPFMPQYAENNRELLRSLTKLVIKEGRGEII